MATIALQVAGTAAAGPLGGAVGATIGYYLDNQFLFPPDPVEGPRINELQIGGADEGGPAHRCYGAASRVAGTILWVSGVKETKKTSRQGGKAGGGQEVTNYTYSVDIAVAFCINEPDVGAVEAIEKIYVDAGVIYEDDVETSLSSTSIAATIEVVTTSDYDHVNDEFVTVTDYLRMTLTSTDTTQLLNDLRPGFDAVVGGFTETDYNGTFRVLSVGESGANTFAVFKIDAAFSQSGEAAGNTITVDQGTAQGVPKFDTTVISTAPTMYLGTETQTQNSVIVGHEGATNVPGYRGVVYAVFNDFKLTPFGNRIPNLWQAQITRDSTDDLQDIVGDILTESELESSEYDITGLSGITCGGYATRGPIPSADQLRPLMLAYDIVHQEADGVISFLRKTATDEVTLALEDFTAREESQEPDEPFRLRDSDAGGQYAEIDVKYVDDENDYQPGSERERRRTSHRSTEKRVLNLAITMDGSQARDIAAKVLWMSWVGKRTAAIALPGSYLHLQENDRVTWSYNSETYKGSIAEIIEGVNGVSVLQVQVEDQTLLTHSSSHTTKTTTDPGFYYAPEMSVEVIDSVCLRDADAETAGAYVVAAADNFTESYQGAVIFESNDNSNYNELIDPYATMATMGIATTTLNNQDDESARWDNGSSVTVLLYEGELESKTADEVRAGANRAIIGEEVVGFTTATLNGDGTYTISGFLRGLANTEYAGNDHTDGERFVMLDVLGVEFFTHAISSVGQTKYYKSVASGGEITDAPARTVVLGGGTILPPSPVHVRGVRNSSGDLDIHWRRKSRSYFTWYKLSDPPLYEDSESYEIDIMSGSTVLRTITSSSNTTTYTAAQQTTDFGSTQSSVKVRVYQMSARIGRGRQTENTI